MRFLVVYAITLGRQIHELSKLNLCFSRPFTIKCVWIKKRHFDTKVALKIFSRPPLQKGPCNFRNNRVLVCGPETRIDVLCVVNKNERPHVSWISFKKITYRGTFYKVSTVSGLRMKSFMFTLKMKPIQWTVSSVTSLNYKALLCSCT